MAPSMQAIDRIDITELPLFFAAQLWRGTIIVWPFYSKYQGVRTPGVTWDRCIWKSYKTLYSRPSCEMTTAATKQDDRFPTYCSRLSSCESIFIRHTSLLV